MKKQNFIIFVILFSLFLIGCDHDSNVMTSEKPEWLNELIADIQNEVYYAGSVIYRHEWKSEFYYHLEIPVSSCAYCDVYNQNGVKIVWSDEHNFEDYLQNRKNEKVIWDWPGRLI